MTDEMPVDPEEARRMDTERQAIDEAYRLARRLIRVAGGREEARGFIDSR